MIAVGKTIGPQASESFILARLKILIRAKSKIKSLMALACIILQLKKSSILVNSKIMSEMGKGTSSIPREMMPQGQ